MVNYIYKANLGVKSSKAPEGSHAQSYLEGIKVGLRRLVWRVGGGCLASRDGLLQDKLAYSSGKGSSCPWLKSQSACHVNLPHLVDVV